MFKMHLYITTATLVSLIMSSNAAAVANVARASTTSTILSMTTLPPLVVDMPMEAKARADDCYVTTLFGAQSPIVTEICPPTTTLCSVCVGCNAAVTVCNGY
ncbi:hypothetical protein LTR37_020917 [Vermiconidia calcicola]|uniref:Uncharacterized protein n=1 Tax=Vermiconidia calcicola TaxID=1690605 RepID=A0ACC3MBB2_9PEZI|nr:hypothetical protein LTR37_020917 [Vermiconidia calcicola]